MKYDPPEQVTLLPNMIASRKGWFQYKNPAGWNFRLIHIIHILCNICDYLCWFFLHKRSKPSQQLLDKHLPAVEEVQLHKLKEPPADGIQILWIGHATLLVQIEGYNIITDPVFGNFCGPNRWMGYSRFRPPSVTIEDLKNKVGIEIHAVVVSHNHYDHLDEDSVQELVNLYGNMIQWFVPKGMKDWFESRGCTSVTHMDWWDKEQMHSRPDKSTPPTVTFTPAKHWSGRGICNYYCRHLWGSWLICGEKSVFYFAGDTGYAADVFDQIKRVAGQIDVAAIPIGAYKPRSVMKAQHVDPYEAVRIHKELGATTSIGIHWGTFALSNEEIHEPVKDLTKAKEEAGVSLTDFIVMDHGEVKSFPIQQK